MNVALPVCLWGGWSETFYKCVYNISMPISTAQMHRQALGKEDIGERPAGDAGGLSLRQKQGGGFSALPGPGALLWAWPVLPTVQLLALALSVLPSPTPHGDAREKSGSNHLFRLINWG